MSTKHAIASLCVPTILLLHLGCHTAQAQTFSVIKLENKAYKPVTAQAQASPPSADPTEARTAPLSEMVRPREISIYVKNVNFYSLLSRLAARLNFALSADSDIDLDKQITLDLYLTPIDDAMRLIASKIGYEVTVNEAQKTVHLHP